MESIGLHWISLKSYARFARRHFLEIIGFLDLINSFQNAEFFPECGVLG